MVITGTLPRICYAEGMTRYLHAHEIPIFEYPAFANTLRFGLRERAEALAAAAGAPSEFVGKSRIRSVI
jgi:hypothetical protein